MAKEVYICESCYFAYASMKEAKKCEMFCTKHHSCSLEITKLSMGKLKIEG